MKGSVLRRSWCLNTPEYWVVWVTCGRVLFNKVGIYVLLPTG